MQTILSKRCFLLSIFIAIYIIVIYFQTFVIKIEHFIKFLITK